MKTAHTQGPWSYDLDENEIHSNTIQDCGGDPAHICEMMGPNAEANAAHIVKCVNLRDELVSELEFLFNESLKARLDSNCVTPHDLKINDLIKRAKGDL